MRLSVGMITLNEAIKIGRTLAAVSGWAQQIVVVDCGSTDGTPEICRQFGAEVIHQAWLGYGAQRNLVNENCRLDWILVIDADEVVTPELKRAIEKELINPQHAVYAIRHQQILLGREIQHGGWQNEFCTRLFRRGSGYWNNALVHESFVTAYSIGKIDAPLAHYSYTNFQEYWNKQERYTTLEAQAAYREGKRPRPAFALGYSIYFFLIVYFRKLGLLDGATGLQISFMRAFYFIQTDRKLAELYDRHTRVTEAAQ